MLVSLKDGFHYLPRYVSWSGKNTQVVTLETTNASVVTAQLNFNIWHIANSDLVLPTMS